MPSSKLQRTALRYFVDDEGICVVAHSAAQTARLTLAYGDGASHNVTIHRCPTAKKGLNMKHFLFAAAAVMATAPAFSADVGALGGLGEPGFFGQIDIRRLPKPQLVFPEPIVIRQEEGGVAGEPVYLRVPPDHAKNWRKHCHIYKACDQRVYFVEDNWYNKVYVPEYRKKRGGAKSNGNGHGEDNDKGHGKGRDKD